MNIDPIRPLVRGDLPHVARLVDDNQMFPSDMLDDMTRPFFADDPGQRWLVHDDGQDGAVCYFAAEGLADRVWNLLMIAVHPSRHGKGLGQALMRQVEQDLARDGARMLIVDTSGAESFDRTRRFYDMLGYEREARIRDYWAEGDDKIIFRKTLRVR